MHESRASLVEPEPKKRKATDELEGASAAVYKAKNSITHRIPIPAFQALVVGHFVDLTVALRIYPRIHTVKKKKPSGVLMIPKILAPISASSGKRVRAEYILSPECGVDPEWLAFVAEYVGYVVRQWKTLAQARCWCKDRRSTFLELVKAMWLEASYLPFLAHCTIPDAS